MADARIAPRPQHNRTLSDQYRPAPPLVLQPRSVARPFHDLNRERSNRRSSLSNSPGNIPPVQCCDYEEKMREIENTWRALKPRLANRSALSCSHSYASVPLSDHKPCYLARLVPCGCNSPAPVAPDQGSDSLEIGNDADEDESMGSTRINQIRVFDNLMAGKTPSHCRSRAAINLQLSPCIGGAASAVKVFATEGKLALPNATCKAADNSHKDLLLSLEDDAIPAQAKRRLTQGTSNCIASWRGQCGGPFPFRELDSNKSSQFAAAGRPRSISRWADGPKKKVSKGESSSGLGRCKEEKNCAVKPALRPTKVSRRILPDGSRPLSIRSHRKNRAP